MDVAILASSPLDIAYRIRLIEEISVATGRPVDLIDLATVGEPLLGLVPAIGSAGALAAAALVLARRTLSAFVASALAIVGVIGTAGAAMYPFVMPSSSQPNASLTVWDSVSSHLTLGLMFWATLIFMPLIVFYTSWAYRVMRGKVTLAHIRANEHTAY